MRPWRVWPRVVPGSSLDEDTLQTMWELRVRQLELKPHVDRDEDLRRFKIRCRDARAVMLLEASDAIAGFFVLHWLDAEASDGPYVALLPEYGYVDRPYRGHPTFALAAFRGFVRVLREADGRPVWFAGVGYPRSFVLLQSLLDPMHTPVDTDAPPAAQHALQLLRELYIGEDWDPVTHQVQMPTIPEDPPAQKLAILQEQPIWTRYEAVNPRWREGVGLGIAGELKAQALVTLVRTATLRSLGTWGRRIRPAG